MATIDNAYGKGVVYTAAIDLGAQKPADSRIAVQTITERDDHVTGNRAYPGMQVYVADDNKTYIYLDNGSGTLEWKELLNSTYIVNDLTTDDANRILSAAQGKALQDAIAAISGGDLTVPVATDSVVGGVKSGGDITVASGTGVVTVNKAAQLTNARTIRVSGAVTGSVAFDGTADVTINTTLTDHVHDIDDVTGLQTALDAKVAATGETRELNFSGATVKVKTLSKTEAQSAEGTEAASIQFVSDVVDARIAQSDAMIYKGTVADKTTITDVNTTAKTGWTYRVTADLDFTSDDYIVSDVKEAHAGDLIICRTDGSVETPATWDIVKHNDNGQVIGPESSVADRIVTFSDGTGKVVKDGGKTIAEVEAAAVATVVGEDTDVSTDNTIKGVKKYVEEKVSGSSITSGTITRVEDATPESVSFSTNSITINLKKYALQSAFDTLEGEVDANTAKLADVNTTVGAEIEEAVNAAAITSGEITRTVGDSAAESVNIASNKITINLKAYALSSTVTALTSRVGAVEQKLNGINDTVTAYVGTQVSAAKTDLVGADSDEAEANTIYGAKAYADQVADAVSGNLTALTGRVDGLETEIDANTNKLKDITGTVGATIDSKISSATSVAAGSLGTVTTAYDARYIQESEVSTISEEEIAGLFSTV